MDLGERGEGANMADLKVAAVIVAAGRGTRAGGGVPKQWRDLGGLTVAARSIAAFRNHPRVGRVVLVLHPDDMGLAAGWLGHADMAVVAGGATRAQSVGAGLAALAEDTPDRVLIHDVARPLVSAMLIDRVIDALDTAPGAAPALAVTDALWTGDAGRVTGTQDREGLWRAQTPQGFHFAPILAAHRTAPADAADDVAVARAAGLDVSIVEGEERNLKITAATDFARAESYLGDAMDIRCGNGFDVHAFTEGDAVILCGVSIPIPMPCWAIPMPTWACTPSLTPSTVRWPRATSAAISRPSIRSGKAPRPTSSCATRRNWR